MALKGVYKCSFFGVLLRGRSVQHLLTLEVPYFWSIFLGHLWRNSVLPRAVVLILLLQLALWWISSLLPCGELPNTQANNRPQNHVKIAVPWWTNDCPIGSNRAWKRALSVSRHHLAEAEHSISKRLHARERLTFRQHERNSCKRSPLQCPAIHLPQLYGSILRRISSKCTRTLIPSIFVAA
jgi:hypothetical protein